MPKCLNCGAEFVMRAVNQIYCCKKCAERYVYLHHGGPPHIVLSFDCAMCGRPVVTSDKHDKRTRFCSHECEKKYWRHPPWENETCNVNYRSVGEYLAHERRTNGEG